MSPENPRGEGRFARLRARLLTDATTVAMSGGGFYMITEAVGKDTKQTIIGAVITLAAGGARVVLNNINSNR